jgi:hypothetical protein
MPASREEVTAYYRLAIHFGLLSRDASIAWADRQILAATGEADLQDIEISLAASRPIDDLLSMLKEPWQPTPPHAYEMLAALLNRKIERGEITPPEAANNLFGLHATHPDADDVLGREIAWIDEAFEEYMMGPKDAPQFVREFLRRFAAVELPD